MPFRTLAVREGKKLETPSLEIQPLSNRLMKPDHGLSVSLFIDAASELVSLARIQPLHIFKYSRIIQEFPPSLAHLLGQVYPVADRQRAPH